MGPRGAELSLEACLEWHRRLGGRASLALVARVDSTNRLAREVARVYLADDAPPPPLILVAREQTAGRGRRGRRWQSPAGAGIYTSLLTSVATGAALAALPLRVPLALCEALDAAGVECRIKWPNDLMVDGRKLGGVLIEALAGRRAVVVGYGLNGTQAADELPGPEATSLRLASGAPPDLSRLAIELAARVLASLAEDGPPGSLVEGYRSRCAHSPGERMLCRLGEEEVSGRFAGIDARGRLRLAVDGGERRIASGDLVEAPGAP